MTDAHLRLGREQLPHEASGGVIPSWGTQGRPEPKRPSALLGAKGSNRALPSRLGKGLGKAHLVQLLHLGSVAFTVDSACLQVGAISVDIHALGQLGLCCVSIMLCCARFAALVDQATAQ